MSPRIIQNSKEIMPWNIIIYLRPGDVGAGTGYQDPTWFRSNSIHDCFNRFVTIHGVHNSETSDNVGYNTRGHGYFIEERWKLSAIYTIYIWIKNIKIRIYKYKLANVTEQTKQHQGLKLCYVAQKSHFSFERMETKVST